MNSDACFRIGSTHKICQDYAVAGVRQDDPGLPPNPVPYAIVSDGCSGIVDPEVPGSPHTDFGSRFMARAAQTERDSFRTMSPHAVAIRAEAASFAAELPRRALDATLIRAAAFEEGVHVHWVGDGVVATRRRHDKLISYQTVKFDNNMPMYMSYAIYPQDLERHKKLCKSRTISGNSFRDGQWGTKFLATHESHFLRDFLFFDSSQYDLVIIMTDGAESFQLKDGTPVHLEQVLEELFAIKGFAGEFINRRVNSFLTRTCVERGWSHADDLSVGGIYLGDAP